MPLSGEWGFHVWGGGGCKHFGWVAERRGFVGSRSALKESFAKQGSTVGGATLAGLGTPSSKLHGVGSKPWESLVGDPVAGSHDLDHGDWWVAVAVEDWVGAPGCPPPYQPAAHHGPTSGERNLIVDLAWDVPSEAFRRGGGGELGADFTLGERWLGHRTAFYTKRLRLAESATST